MYFKQIAEIVSGQKTVTQRVVKSGERESCRYLIDEITEVYGSTGRVKWSTVDTYAVSAKRGKLASMVNWISTPSFALTPRDSFHREQLESVGYQPLRIAIQKIEKLHVQEMDDQIAQLEGVENLQAYIRLWDSINPSRSTCWKSNPLVWRIHFKVVKP